MTWAPSEPSANFLHFPQGPVPRYVESKVRPTAGEATRETGRVRAFLQSNGVSDPETRITGPGLGTRGLGLGVQGWARHLMTVHRGGAATPAAHSKFAASFESPRPL